MTKIAWRGRALHKCRHFNSIKHLTYTKISISATEEAAAWWKVSLHGNAEPLNQKLPTYCLVGRRTEISFEKSFRILPQPTAAFPRSGASRPSPSGLGKTVIFVDYGQVSFEGRRWRRKRQGNNTMVRCSSDTTGTVHPSTPRAHLVARPSPPSDRVKVQEGCTHPSDQRGLQPKVSENLFASSDLKSIFDELCSTLGLLRSVTV